VIFHCVQDDRRRKRKRQGRNRSHEKNLLDKIGWVSDNLRLVDAYLQAGLDALGDGTRMAIFQRLANGPMAVNELAGPLPVSRPAVSQHLRVLKNAGLVTDRKDGTRRMYQLDPEGVARLRAHFDQVWEKALGAFQSAAVTRTSTLKKGEGNVKDNGRGSRSQKHSGGRAH
jgi:DNA-binding transcriptional ArsR family regulator